MNDLLYGPILNYIIHSDTKTYQSYMIALTTNNKSKKQDKQERLQLATCLAKDYFKKEVVKDQMRYYILPNGWKHGSFTNRYRYKGGYEVDTCIFKDNKLHGRHRCVTYNSDSDNDPTHIEECIFKDGLRHGKYRRIKKQCSPQPGVKAYYIKIDTYDNDIIKRSCSYAYCSEETMTTLVSINIIIYYSPNIQQEFMVDEKNNMLSFNMLMNGRMDGPHVRWHKEGHYLLLYAEYKEGSLDGLRATYDNQGRPTKETYYKQGLKHGTEKHYDEGVLMTINEYDHDILIDTHVVNEISTSIDSSLNDD
jgi:antitoxin component YwqK of YwqJK toxin-antitoxin module